MYWKYFKTVLKHKWFVLTQCWRMDTTPWRAIVHDISKFRPSEFFAYAHFFNGGPYPTWEQCKHEYGYPYSASKEGIKEAFDKAWLLHQKRNPHHWQYWILQNDTDGLKVLDMPDKYIREMIADWAGAGLAYTGKLEVVEWYENNKNKMVLSPTTREAVEYYLQEYYGRQ